MRGTSGQLGASIEDGSSTTVPPCAWHSSAQCDSVVASSLPSSASSALAGALRHDREPGAGPRGRCGRARSAGSPGCRRLRRRCGLSRAERRCAGELLRAREQVRPPALAAGLTTASPFPCALTQRTLRREEAHVRVARENPVGAQIGDPPQCSTSSRWPGEIVTLSRAAERPRSRPPPRRAARRPAATLRSSCRRRA